MKKTTRDLIKLAGGTVEKPLGRFVQVRLKRLLLRQVAYKLEELNDTLELELSNAFDDGIKVNILKRAIDATFDAAEDALAKTLGK